MKEVENSSDRLAKLNELSGQVIGAAIAVHKELGPGYAEALYERAMAIELRHRNIPFNEQVTIQVGYRGEMVGEGRIDLLVQNDLIVELKAIDTLAPIHTAQVVSYLKATGKNLGLLINFNTPRLRDGIKRVIFP